METRLLEVAKEASLEAGKIISGYFGGSHEYNFKNEDKSDFATQADLAAQEKIVGLLTKNFPDHNVIAEENVRIDNKSEYTWAIDPLDGTFSFSIGMPYFAVSIGLIKENEPVLGVIYHVPVNDLYYAQKGKGAFVNKQQVHVSKKDNLFDASMLLDFGHKKRRPQKIDLYILPLLEHLGHIYSVGSASMCMVLTAKGIQEGMIAQAWIWDFAAGAVIVEEAGGKVTDFEGKEIDWTKDRLNVLATNGLIHDEILEVLSPSLRGQFTLSLPKGGNLQRIGKIATLIARDDRK